MNKTQALENTISQQETQLIPPSLYKVLLHNDDYTTMDFVVDVLQKFFDMSEDKAFTIMFEIHTKGKAVCGVYPFDIAETKVSQVNIYARRHEHPLLCSLEKE